MSQTMNACHGFTAQPSNFSVSGGSAQFVFVFVNCDGYCSSGGHSVPVRTSWSPALPLLNKWKVIIIYTAIHKTINQFQI